MLLLRASGALGSIGPRLAALCARAAEVASDAAHLVSPVEECPGCGAMATALAMAGRGVCPECAENEEEGPPIHPRGDWDATGWQVTGGPRVYIMTPDRSKLN
jgi:hypothetical protein